MKKIFLFAAGLLFLGAAAAQLEVETGTCFHCAVRPARNLAARIDLDTATPAVWKGTVVFRDYFGRTFSVPVEGRGAKGTPLRVKLPEPPGMGIWRGTATLTSEKGDKAACTATFAVTDPHPVTPLAPTGTFRIGINYHMERYYPALRQQTLQALVGVGAKMMRGNLGALCLNQPKEGEYRWENMDAMVSELQAHGIAIDAILPPVPAWARHPDYANVTNGPVWVLPTKPGVDAAYGRALAARYGTKIAYYEIGNELDLLPASHLTIEQAMARQRDYYAAIKSVCPEARVIPGGWAVADSSHWMVSQKGYQERFMKEAQDACDFHPIHIHGSYDQFRKEMQRFFAWRGKAGVTVPWYANETAASSCAGQEDSAAKWVWQKALWSWAHGSSDYIWYNLRSIGPDPNNGEHAYGIFTMDLQPRATAAAFSSLTAVFNGQAFDAVLADNDACQVYRFRGDGARTVVGWNAYLQQPRQITLKTDATACEAVDLMGNRTPVAVRDGAARIALGVLPVAYVLAGATRAEVDAAEIAAISGRKLVDLFVEPSEKQPGQAAFVWDSMARYHGFCDGNVDTEHRLWKGPQDLSVKAFIWKPKWETIHARVEVTDDRPVPYKAGAPRTGDHIRLVFNGKEEVFAPVRREGDRSIYEFDLPWHAVPGPLTFEVYDDDGEGLDGFLGGDDFLLKYR